MPWSGDILLAHFSPALSFYVFGLSKKKPNASRLVDIQEWGNKETNCDL